MKIGPVRELARHSGKVSAAREPRHQVRTWSIDWHRTAALVLAILVTVAFAIGGVAFQLENSVRNVFFALRDHDASGRMHIVEMDAASIAAIGQWPWPRGHHAAVVDALHRSGAASITFDVDLSAKSDPVEDALLARSFANARGKVTLPTFTQTAVHGSAETLDSLPMPALRDNVTLASVSVSPDSDGIMRDMLLGTVTGGVPRPSLSALIANRDGIADREFPIDFAIDPASIPRHSFADIESGRFAPGTIAGKDIIIGATAIEMGDRYVVPRHGILPGVVVQALATETLYRGVPQHSGSLVPLLLGGLLAVWLTGAATLAGTAWRGAAALSVLGAALFIGWTAALILFELAPAIILVVITALARAVLLFARKTHEERLLDRATGLPNRLALDASGTQAPGRLAVVAVIDQYDRMASLLGSADCAVLVQRIAERLRSGSGSGVIYRVENRALAWIPQVEAHEVEDILAGLGAVMRVPVEIAGRRVDASLHFGVAHAGELDEAIVAAGEALRTRTPWRYHVAAERAALEFQISLMGELDAAIARGELEVLYQPKLELKSDRVTSVEALVRWHHPSRGFLGPDQFVPLAEERGRIAELTLFVLERTIADLCHWRVNGVFVKAAVNISAKLVDSPSFAAAVEAMLQRSQLPREQLIFEVTESATIGDPAAAVAALNRFKELGISISLDDYGTGQSTLSYIKQLPLSELKIDRSFIQYAHRDISDATLVRSTIGLAHELGLAVVAEGVEEPECLAFLREVGCDFAQGYLIGKAVAADAIALLAGDALSFAA